MLNEYLNPAQILPGFTGTFEEARDALLASYRTPNQINNLKAAFAADKIHEYAFVSADVAIPHVQLKEVTRPEIFICTSPTGLKMDGRTVHVLVMLITPAEEPALHLQLLQGLAALIPGVTGPLLRSTSPDEIIAAIRCGEDTIKPSFINLTQRQVAFELESDLERGLSAEEATKRLKFYGSNEIKKSRRTPWYVRLLRNFFSFFAILLWFAAALCYIPGVDMPQLGTAVLIVVIINGIFSFLQEYKTDHAVESLQRLIEHTCRVIRGGQTIEIPAALLVPGDLLLIEEGDIVPADARLVEAFEVEVDNSSLTGESTSAKRYKSDKPVLIEGKFLWIELPNIIFAGSTLIRGQGKAIVFGTGMNSEIGKIAGLTQATKAEESPLQKQLKGTVYAIALLAFTLGLAFLFLGWQLAGLNFITAFIFFIGIFVANVPEGLLPTVTLALAMGVTRMAKRNALVKNLAAVETLGCTTVICCDKTGTLTQNLMMVSEVYVDSKLIKVKGVGYRPEGELLLDESALSGREIANWPALRRLLDCAHSCNNARLDSTGATHNIIGDPTEGALQVLAARAGVRGTYHRIHINPFESVRKRMSVIVSDERRPVNVSYLKGAPSEVLSICNQILEGNEVRAMTDADRERISRKQDDFANRGLRVLSFAYRDDNELQALSKYDLESVEQNHIFLGLTAMTDPVRPEVPAAVASCHTAGIRVIMITGDYPLTAKSIAAEIGLGSKNMTVLSGADIAATDDAELKRYLEQGESIFARVSPEQKLRIVQLLQELDEIVAVTGDGVNDGPALKRADIGVAMGQRGTDVAREAAEIILTDDNFASIVAAIEEGRAIFENIKRFVSYIFNSNPQELYPYILWMIIPGYPLAMTVMGVLAVDVGTDLIPAMGLGIEPPERGIMEKAPRSRKEKILSLRLILRSYFVQGSILAFACFATYYYFGWVMGFMPDGFSFLGVPKSPGGLRMENASHAYLMSLAAFFFPTITSQIANVLCKRSSRTSIFSRDFLPEEYRARVIERIQVWRPHRRGIRIRINYFLTNVQQIEVVRASMELVITTLLFPFRLAYLAFQQGMRAIEKPVLRPLQDWLAGFLERHYVIVNFVSNPLINLGIAFELALCFVFFYTPLKETYYFEPVPWHVYVFGLNGFVLLFIFEEVRKYILRRIDRRKMKQEEQADVA